MSFSLRDYQVAAKDAVYSEWDKGVRATMLVCPTGVGKSSIGSVIASECQSGRVLIVADQDEIIEQWVQTVKVATGITPDIEKADLFADHTGLHTDSHIIVASKDSLHPSRIKKFKPQDFTHIIIDECDKAVKKNISWWRVLEHFYQNQNIKTLGLTATPLRSDRRKLLFDTVAFQYSLMEAIHDGWLVFPDQRFLHVEGLDFGRVKTRGGDFAAEAIEEELGRHKLAKYVIEPTLDIVGDSKLLVLVVSPTVAHAEMTADIINYYRPGQAVSINGKTDKDLRKKEIERYRNREFQFLSVCGIGTRGMDVVPIGFVVGNRFTRSITFYTQMIGRGLRVMPGILKDCPDRDFRKAAIAGSEKPRCLIIDPVGNSSRHKNPICTADVLGGAFGEAVIFEAAKKARAKAKKTGGPVNILRELESADERLKKKAKKLQELEIPATDSSYSLTPVSFFDAGDSAGSHGIEHKRLPTRKMQRFLQQQKAWLDGMSFHEARKKIIEIRSKWSKDQCSDRMKEVLGRNGERTDVHKAKGLALLDILQARGWRKRDYDLTKDRWSIRSMTDGTFSPIVKDPMKGGIKINQKFKSVEECRDFIRHCVEAQSPVSALFS